ncbi:MAG: glycosyltransferase family 2 protein [Planctomycetaceae bacterium]|nr:glycosyltransferase family 2 protein [Planctomycetaceae bacterium]
MRPKISAIIPCKNEQRNIRECLESLYPLADEILVADSGSTDRTMEIAREFDKTRVIEREYRTSGDFKNWAIPQAKHEWIILLDADERLTEALRHEIMATLEAPTCDGYWIYRANHFMGHPVPYGDSGTDKVVRLFRRDLGRYEGPSDHGEVHISTGRVGVLKTKMLHFTCWDYDQVFQKFHRYTKLQAEQWHAVGKDTSYFRLFLNPIFRFIREYFLQLGFLNGKAGVQLAMLAAFYSFTKQARLWELNHGLPQPVPEQDRESRATCLPTKVEPNSRPQRAA